MFYLRVLCLASAPPAPWLCYLTGASVISSYLLVITLRFSRNQDDYID